MMAFCPEHPKWDPKSEIYTPKRDDEHPHTFYMRSPPSGLWWDRENYICPKVTTMGSIIGHKTDYNGVGALKGQRHIPREKLTLDLLPGFDAAKFALLSIARLSYS